MFRSAFPVVGLLLAAIIPTSTAHAAASYDGCAGYIDALPAVITTQGVWCLRKDLNTAQTTGAAITVQTNNVTIDCNDFKLGGLPAGLGTYTDGITSLARSNITVRNCSIRGFYRGVALSNHSEGTSEGHLVENNRIGSNTRAGVFVEGQGSTIRNNRIFDTGGSLNAPYEAYGIITVGDVDVLDNAIRMVASTTGHTGLGVGIESSYNDAGSIRENRIGRVVGVNGYSYGIRLTFGSVSVRDNDVTSAGMGTVAKRVGIACVAGTHVARDNVINGYVTWVDGCVDVSNTKVE